MNSLTIVGDTVIDATDVKSVEQQQQQSNRNDGFSRRRTLQRGYSAEKTGKTSSGSGMSRDRLSLNRNRSAPVNVDKPIAQPRSHLLDNEEGRNDETQDDTSPMVDTVLSRRREDSAYPRQRNESKLSSQHDQVHPHSHFLSPTDLSGYIKSSSSTKASSINQGEWNKVNSTPNHALAMPLPCTPLHSHKRDELCNKAQESNNSLPPSAMIRNTEKSCSRVEQYLQSLEERIKHVKKSHTSCSVQRYTERSTGGNCATLPTRHRPCEEDTKFSVFHSVDNFEENKCTDFEENKSKPKEVMKQPWLPTLLSPGYNNKEDMWCNTNQTIKTSFASFQSKQAIDETNERHHYQTRVGTSLTIIPLSPQDNYSSTLHAEDKVREAEKSVGLKSLQEYKQLLHERTMELEGLEYKYKTQLKEAEREVEGHDAQVKQFRNAMKEAQSTVEALEKTIQSLEAAVTEKDAFIAQLECRIKALEMELEKNRASKLEEEIHHLEAVTMLNVSITQMGTDIKEKETSLLESETKMTELEVKLRELSERYVECQTHLTDAQKIIIEKDLKLKFGENELCSTKEMLQGHIELYKNEVSSSLQNTTRLMELMTTEKDNLIESLNSKIQLLEESLEELKKEKESTDQTYEEKEKELNEKIHTLALALTKKDKQIDSLEKTKKSHRSKGRSAERKHTRFHDQREHRYSSITDEERYYYGSHPDKKHIQYFEAGKVVPQRSRRQSSSHYFNDARDDEAVMMMDDADYIIDSTVAAALRHPVRELGVEYPHYSADEYTYEGDDSIYDFA